MVTQVKKLMTKNAANRTQEAFGSWQPQFGSRKCATQDVPPPGVDVQARDGGLHPETHADDVAKRELVAIYNRYVAVYDKVSTTRKRKSYYRRPKHTMKLLNDMRSARPDRRSLVERVMAE